MGKLWRERFVAIALTLAIASCLNEDDNTTSDEAALAFPQPGETIAIGFELDASEQPIARGTYIDEQYAAAGVHFNGAFATGARPIDFSNYQVAPLTDAMLCTWVAWQDTGLCFPPVGIMSAQLVIDFDFPACDVTIEGRTRGDGGQDGDILTMTAYDAGGAVVDSVSEYVNTGPNPPTESVVHGTVSGNAITRVIIEDGELDALDTLVVHRCEPDNEPPVPVCDNAEACNVPGECFGIASIDGGSSDPDGDPLTITQSPDNPYPVGTTGVTLSVSDGTDTRTCEAEVTINDCEDPSILCPAPVTLECTGNSCANHAPGDAVAADNCGIASETAPGAECFPLGTSPLPYSATDSSGHVVSCASAVTVVDTLPPSIVCPPPVTRECVNGCAQFTPGPATASDVCGPASVSGPPGACFPVGTTPLPYSAVDAVGLTASCSSSITVADTQPPVVTVGPAPSLAPPNHKYHTITLADCGVTVVDACEGSIPVSPANAAISCVSSDEDDNDTGDGNTINDIVLVDATTVRLRAERSGNGDGRVYNIAFTVTDSSGHTTPGTCRVDVQKGSHPAIDSGPVQTVCNP